MRGSVAERASAKEQAEGPVQAMELDLERVPVMDWVPVPVPDWAYLLSP